MPYTETPPPLRQQIVAMYQPLMRAAQAQLRNPAWAEDAVSATLLAALERPPDFDEPARVRAWVFGVLRHKLVDELRRQGADQPLENVGDATDLDRLLECTDAGDDPAADPAEQLHRARLGRALVDAMAGLPPLQARAFELREWAGWDSDSICRELGVHAPHLWVLLHRARRGLQRQLLGWRS